MSLYEPRSNPDGSYETLLVEKEGPIDWLTLNRPEALNAMSRTLMPSKMFSMAILAPTSEARPMNWGHISRLRSSHISTLCPYFHFSYPE